MVPPAVDLEDEHVRGGGNKVDEQHHGADRDIHRDSGQPAQRSCLGCIRRPLGNLL